MSIRSKTAGEVTKKEVSLKNCFKNWHTRGKELCLGGRTPAPFISTWTGCASWEEEDPTPFFLPRAGAHGSQEALAPSSSKCKT